MGIFSRVRDIISSNINAMLERAEDPEKLIKLMIQEMEDTLVEIKASCAGAMAASRKAQRATEQAQAHSDKWGDKAALAVQKGRDDLAREALVEKRRYRERAEALEREFAQCEGLVEQYQNDIVQLEERLAAAREKQRVLVQRHVHARRKKRAEQDIRRMDTTDAFVRFEQFENRIDRMEAEADLVNAHRKHGLEQQFAEIETDEEIERELQALKESATAGKE
jgi:phage shock protein A